MIKGGSVPNWSIIGGIGLGSLLIYRKLLRTIIYTPEHQKQLKQLSWYQNYSIGTQLGAGLIAGGCGAFLAGLVAPLITGKHLFKALHSNDLSLFIALLTSTTGLLLGLWFYKKAYLKDPIYRDIMMGDFWRKPLKETIQYYSWDSLLDVADLQQIVQKINMEIGEHPSFQSIWNLYNEEIVRKFVKYNLLDGKMLRELCLQELALKGFKEMVARYNKWWLDDGLVQAQEVAPHFLQYYYAHQDGLEFLRTSMEWPVGAYGEAFPFRHPDELQKLRELYGTYKAAKGSYEARKSHIQAECSEMTALYEREEAIALQRIDNKRAQADTPAPARARVEEECRLERLEVDNKRRIHTTQLEAKKRDLLSVLEANWTEIGKQIRENFNNVRAGRPLVGINTAFAAATTILPAASTAQGSSVTIINQVAAAPVYPAPVYQAPVYQAPVYQAPVYPAPGYPGAYAPQAYPGPQAYPAQYVPPPYSPSPAPSPLHTQSGPSPTAPPLDNY